MIATTERHPLFEERVTVERVSLAQVVVDQAEQIERLQAALAELARTSRNLYAVCAIHLTQETRLFETSYTEALRAAED